MAAWKYSNLGVWWFCGPSTGFREGAASNRELQRKIPQDRPGGGGG